MRTIAAVLVASSLLVSNAFAASTTVAPLPSGKPAGVSQAASLGPNFALILLGVGVVVGGIVMAASGAGGDGIITPVPSSTSTSATTTGTAP